MRQWQPADLDKFAEISADPEVMRYFPEMLSRAKCEQYMESWQSAIAAQGWGVWAVALKNNNEFIGITGLQFQSSRFSFSPCTEIAWRIARQYWRQGYAFEAANATLKFGFEVLGLAEIVAFTAVDNLASIGLMQKLAMQKRERFLHPALQKEHPLAEHILYVSQCHSFAALN